MPTRIDPNLRETDYRNAKWERRPHGHILLDGHEVATTLTCCHCGVMFISVKGSGTQRGFCLHCMDVTCGSPVCNAVCRPLEKQLDEIERRSRGG